MLSCVQLFAILWTVYHQAPLSMEFSRQEYWSGLPFSSPGNLPDPGIEPESPSWQADSLPSKSPGKLMYIIHTITYQITFYISYLYHIVYIIFIHTHTVFKNADCFEVFNYILFPFSPKLYFFFGWPTDKVPYKIYQAKHSTKGVQYCSDLRLHEGKRRCISLFFFSARLGHRDPGTSSLQTHVLLYLLQKVSSCLRMSKS